MVSQTILYVNWVEKMLIRKQNQPKKGLKTICFFGVIAWGLLSLPETNTIPRNVNLFFVLVLQVTFVTCCKNNKNGDLLYRRAVIEA